MRKHCWDCVYKHLAAAFVADMETVLGYPKFKLLVVGNLDHASQECVSVHPMFAMVIREHRLKRWRSQSYQIPYEELADFADMMSQMPDDEKYPDVTEACCKGLAKDAAGNWEFSMDTRP